MKHLTLSSLLLGCLLATSCNEQNNPEPQRKAIKAERLVANQPVKRLTSEGKIPAPKKMGEPQGKVKYQQFCASCHGKDGAADTPTALAMNPKPRAFTDAAWQDDPQTTDERIKKVIKDGGPAVGLSATMAPWGSVLSDAEMDEIVALIRSFKK